MFLYDMVNGNGNGTGTGRFSEWTTAMEGVVEDAHECPFSEARISQYSLQAPLNDEGVVKSKCSATCMELKRRISSPPGGG